MKAINLLAFVTSGSRGWAQYYADDGALFLRIGNLDHGTIALDLSECQHVRPPAGTEGRRTAVRPGDILISITADVGMVGLVPEGLGEAYVNQHIALARPAPGVNPRWLAWSLAAPPAKRQFRERDRGATKMGLGLDDVRSVSLLVPPMEDQRRTVEEIESRFSVATTAEAQCDVLISRASALRHSTLTAAFSGRLVPQDHDDEPAAVLLERIQSERRGERPPTTTTITRTRKRRPTVEFC